jgi:predicted metal-binding protein
MMHVTICTSCPLGSLGFDAALAVAMTQSGISATIAKTDCMSGCTRPSAVAFRSLGKTAYLFGDLTADDLPALISFAARYAASADGTFADARVLGSLRTKAIARIPG